MKQSNTEIIEGNKLPDPDFDDFEDEPEFHPCSRCDGHPACEDFGCAFELGCGHLVKTEPGIDFP